MKCFLPVLFLCYSFYAVASDGDGFKAAVRKEFHVSVKGDDHNDGSLSRPLKTIMAAANAAMPGDVITVHSGVYREQVIPPRGGNSDKERIVYQAAKGEKVIIKGSEVITGWQKLNDDTWIVRIPNSFFGKFNPYQEYIQGDWFTPKPKDRKYLRGAVYLNGDWLMEAAKKDEVFLPADEKNQLWSAETDVDSTTIWAQFKNADPNKELVEINVRQTVFYPDKPFINFITVRGFTMEHAATNWAPPTAEQMGLIGTHWSRGWIIENNTIQYSKCVGISLGKYGDQWDNNQTESAEGYLGTINRAVAFGWNKGTIGSHVVRNNTIAYCEQAGIVGSMGCAFSIIEGNTIHDIHVRRLFGGAEMAGIKFHGAIDVEIRRNHIYHTDRGIWLDWMAQGIHVVNNLMHDNRQQDLFLEVNHGPMLVYNNIMLSNVSLFMNSSGAVFAHNVFGGKFTVVKYDGRMTPYHLSHSTEMKALHDNPGGDVQFLNNLFVGNANASEYSNALLPVHFEGNVYTKGTVQVINKNSERKFKKLSENANGKTKNYKEQEATEHNALLDQEFDAMAQLLTENNVVYLEINLDKNWLAQKRTLVTTQRLQPAIVSNLPFENMDGSPIIMNTDYFGNKRNSSNPSPGAFEIGKTGTQKIKVWQDK